MQNNLREVYNKIAKDWHSEHRTDQWWLEGMDYFISLFSKNDLILDAGCAGGIKSQYLIEKGLQVVGIDVSENFIEIAKKEVPFGKFFVMDIADVSGLKDTFDGIFLQAVLLHISKKDAPKVVQGLAKKLKKGGYFYITVKGRREGQPEEEIKKDNDYGYEYERFFSYYSVGEIESYLKNIGFEIIFSKVTLSGHTNWVQIIGRKL